MTRVGTTGRIVGLLWVAAVATAVSVPALAAERDGFKRAAQLLEKHYYESAATMLRAGVEGDTAAVALTLGRAYARSAEMYRALHESSLATGSRYLRMLAGQKGRERSHLAALYYGEYLIESGKRDAGIAQLRALLTDAALPARHRQIAEVRIAATQGAATALPHAGAADPEVRSQVASALSASEKRRAEAVTLIDRVVEEQRKRGGVLPMRAVTNALRVYARAGAVDKAFVLLATADAGRASYEEAIGKTKVIRFYDPALLGALADLHQVAAERSLEQAAANERTGDLARYFLAESYLSAGQAAKAQTLLSGLAGAAKLPQAYRERMAIMTAAAQVRSGKAAQGNQALAELSRRYAEDPAILAEVLRACIAAKGNCTAIGATARTLAQQGNTEKYRALHHAIGLQYAAVRPAERALSYLDTARDKSNKNKIDTNDPLLLIRLADLYLETKSFSENLEIYFELSKEFPAVRQLQEAGQGIYSMEFRSAGDVKIL